MISLYLRCEFLEMQARLTDVLCLHHTDSRVSLDSITSFAGSINTKKAYKKFCKSLYQIGVTAEMISRKEREILNIFQPQCTATSSQIDDRTTSQLLVGEETSPISIDRSILAGNKSGGNRSKFSWVRPQIDFLVGPFMLAAAEAGNIQRLNSTLEFIRNINFKGDRKETALHRAAYRGNNDAVDLLLTKGASIAVMDEDNHTPLHHAALNGNTSTVELLLTKGASIEATTKDAETPLHFAARIGHTDTVELLLGKGASRGGHETKSLGT